MTRVLVTGATGFVGRALVSRLLDEEPALRLSCLALPEDPVPPLFTERGVSVFRGDITDRRAVEAAMRGQDAVIHLAGYISYWKRDIRILEAVNVEGVRVVSETAAACGVKKMVHVSSVGTVGFFRDGTEADETTPYNWTKAFPYMETKKRGEDILLETVASTGLSAVILNPASIMGPGDPNPGTAHNRLYENIYRSPCFFGSFAGGLAVVDVRDLCEAIVRAMRVETGAGERFLVVGANVSYRKVLRTIGKYAGKPVLPLPIPPFLLIVAGLLFELASDITRRRPLLTAAYGKLSGWYAYYSNRKSRELLGMRYRDFEETVRDGCRYFEETFLRGR